MGERPTSLAMPADLDHPPKPPAVWKGRSLRARLGFAAAGIRVAIRREKSFRTQLLLAAAAASACLALDTGALWTALVMLAVAFVLALELINAALEYVIDHLHPGFASEMGHAKDAAAGAVLVASLGAASVGAAMVAALLLS
jgi:diacylglycerol kinase